MFKSFHYVFTVFGCSYQNKTHIYSRVRSAIAASMESSSVVFLSVIEPIEQKVIVPYKLVRSVQGSRSDKQL